MNKRNIRESVVPTSYDERYYKRTLKLISAVANGEPVTEVLDEFTGMTNVAVVPKPMDVIKTTRDDDDDEEDDTDESSGLHEVAD